MKVKRVINDYAYDRKRRKKEHRNKDCDNSNSKEFKNIINNIISQKKGCHQ